MTVKARFAFYNPPYPKYGIEAEPSYFIMESDDPRLPKCGNVGADQLLEAGVSLPFTPIYRTWVSMGSPIYRGERVPA